MNSPGKKHFIHPLNNSDISVLSAIYMCHTRHRCYENIANIHNYIHFKTPYKLLTIDIARNGKGEVNAAWGGRFHRHSLPGQFC